MSGGTIEEPLMNEGSNTRKRCKVCVCTSALPYNVEGFVNELRVRYPHLDFDVRYFELPYNNIDDFSVKRKGMDVMILCHSIDNRRFSITDVTDALYDKFLPKAARTLGKQNVCVIAHDFPPEKKLDNPDKYKEEMASFKNNQRTTFKNAVLVMMCGKLRSEGPVELQQSNWDDLEMFLQNAIEKHAIGKKSNSSVAQYSTSMKKNKLSTFVLILAVILFCALLSYMLWYVTRGIISLEATTTIPPTPWTTAHPKTTIPSTTDDVSSQGTSSPSTTIPTLTNQTTDSTTEMASSPSTTTPTLTNQTTDSTTKMASSPSTTTPTLTNQTTDSTTEMASSPSTTTPTLTNQTTDSTTEMASSTPTTITDTTTVSTTPSEQTLGTSPALTTIPPIPPSLTPNSTDTH